MTTTVTIGRAGMTMQDVVCVARHDARVQISPDALESVTATRAPIRASSRALARPIPPPPPVISAAPASDMGGALSRARRHAARWSRRS